MPYSYSPTESVLEENAAKYPPLIPQNILKITNTGIKIINPVIFGRIRKFAEFTPIISNASICSVTRIVPISEAILDPTFPAKINDIIEDENSSRIVSLVTYPIVNLGISGELIFNDIWIAITKPINNDIIITIQRVSTPSL